MKAKKSLGQHFLHSTDVVISIVKAGNVQKTDIVVEVGPGEGVMTKKLLETGACVIAVEKDDRLIPILNEKFAKEIKNGQLKLIHADILHWNIDTLPKGPAFGKKYKVVANIPYYITGQIIRMFLETKNQPESMTLLVQKEVAERITTRESGEDLKESLLSLSVKAFGDPKYIRTVGKGAFTPAPTVESAVLNIENINKKRLNGVDEKLFFKMLHAGFAHKRKQLLPNLSEFYKNKYTKENIIKIFNMCKIDTKTRAEDLNIETWVKLCKHF